jgi:OOP family OmpA-OmpF porin
LKLARLIFPIFMMASTSAAANDGAYFSLRGGLTSPLDLEYTRPTTLNKISSSYENGWNGAAAIGSKSGNTRFELEGSYQTSKIDSHKVSGVVGGSDGSVGETTVAAAMLNAYYDFDFGDSYLFPYIGVGLGAAQVKYEGHRSTLVGLVDDKDTALAYQGMAGFSYALDDVWNLTMEYRYFGTEGVKLEASKEDVEYTSHSFMAGLTRKF